MYLSRLLTGVLPKNRKFVSAQLSGVPGVSRNSVITLCHTLPGRCFPPRVNRQATVALG